MNKNTFTTRKLVLVSMIIACQVILTRYLGIELAQNQRIAFAFIPVAVNGVLFGPLTTGISSVIADIVGYLLHPTGPYFPGFSLSAFLVGVSYGIFLHGRVTYGRILGASLTACIVNLVFNTLWLSILFGNPYRVVFLTRLPFQLILFGVRFVVLSLVLERVTNPMRQAIS